MQISSDNFYFSIFSGMVLWPALVGHILHGVIREPSRVEAGCPTSDTQSIFPSFEAGIANAISSFKWRKKCIFMKK